MEIKRRRCLASHGPKELGPFHSVARSGQESIAQGLPWVVPRHPIGPEGATRPGENRLRTFEPHRVCSSCPFRAKRLFRLTQGKPWAKVSCPFGAGLSGRRTGAKHGQSVRFTFPQGGQAGCFATTTQEAEFV